MKETNPEYLIHEDYSINMEEISKRLAEIHKTYIPKDDPIMMIVSIHNAYLNQLKEMHNKHGDALKKMIGDNAGQIVDALSQTTVNKLKSNLKDYATFQRDLRWCTVIIALSAIVNVLVLIGRAYG